MSVQNQGVDITIGTADVDLSSYQYCFVNIKSGQTATEIELSDSATADRALGVLQNAPTLGQACVVRVSGVTKVKLGADFATAGLKVGIEASTGRATPLVVADITTNNAHYMGIMLESGSDTDIRQMLLTGCGGLLNQAYPVIVIA